MNILSGLNCLVTGGGGHLGRAIVKSLAEKGATVFAGGRELLKVTSAVEELGSTSGRVFAVELDVTEDLSVSRSVEKISSACRGGLHVLVNNAYSGPMGDIWEQGPEDYLLSLDCVVGGAVRLLQGYREMLEEAGRNEGASIINVSSMYGLVSPDPELYREGFEHFHNPPAYGVAKAGLIQWTKYCAVHLASRGIRCNAVAPGAFPSETVQESASDFISRIEDRAPLGRIGEPADLSGLISFLASPESSYLNGSVIPVDGGWTAQ